MSSVKAGDRVKIIDRKSSASHKHAGEIVTIRSLESTDGEGCEPDYVYIKEHETGGLWLDEVELIKENEMTKFTVGQLVQLVSNAKDLGSVDNERFFGQLLRVERVGEDDYNIRVVPTEGSNGEDDYEYFRESQLEVAEVNFETARAGDKVKDNDGDEYIVLAKVGNIIALSGYGSSQSEFREWYTKSDFEDATFTFIQPETTPVVKEVTLEEVAKSLGVPVETLRIKD